MSIETAWKCLSVGEFISRCNWENITLTSVNSVIQYRESLKFWQCLTSQYFFSHNNWSGQVVSVDSLQLPNISKEIAVFDVTLASDRFWQCFNWSGQQNISPIDRQSQTIEAAEELIEAVEEFTLKDLSQLF